MKGANEWRKEQCTPPLYTAVAAREKGVFRLGPDRPATQQKKGLERVVTPKGGNPGNLEKRARTTGQQSRRVQVPARLPRADHIRRFRYVFYGSKEGR